MCIVYSTYEDFGDVGILCNGDTNSNFKTKPCLVTNVCFTLWDFYLIFLFMTDVVALRQNIQTNLWTIERWDCRGSAHTLLSTYKFMAGEIDRDKDSQTTGRRTENHLLQDNLLYFQPVLIGFRARYWACFYQMSLLKFAHGIIHFPILLCNVKRAAVWHLWKLCILNLAKETAAFREGERETHTHIYTHRGHLRTFRLHSVDSKQVT